MNTPTTIVKTCKFCEQEIMRLDRQWVETRSGDEGGFFDICPDAPTRRAEESGYGRHAPAVAA